MAKRVLIVGGVAGGASCAARLRRLDENVEIVMFERGAHISFANCGLPYYTGGEIGHSNKFFLGVNTYHFSLDMAVDIKPCFHFFNALHQ